MPFARYSIATGAAGSNTDIAVGQHWTSPGLATAWDRPNGTLWSFLPHAPLLLAQSLSFLRDPFKIYIPAPSRRPGLRRAAGTISTSEGSFTQAVVVAFTRTLTL